MKRGNMLISAIVVLMVGAGLALYGYYSFKRQADWDDVQKTAIRVDSGLKHETLIALRSKVADLDAALAHYVGEGGGRQKENRVASIQQAIESLEWAIDHQDTTSTWDGDEGFSFYEKRRYLLAEPSCAESTGKLGFRNSELARACLSYAETALIKPDESPKLRSDDLHGLRTECASEHEAYATEQTAAADARRIEHQRAFPLQIDIRNVGNESVDFGCEIDKNRERGYLLWAGEKIHFEAKKVVIVRISQSEYKFESALTFQVNGKPWNGAWMPDRTDPLLERYALTIAMKGPD
jgi:hypothetical protein